MKAAFKQMDITPDINLGIIPQGMGLRHAGAIEVLNDLKMGCLLIEDDEYNRLLIVAADLFGIDPYLMGFVRNHAYLFGVNHVIVNCSHTHYQAGTLGNMGANMGPYYQDFAQRVVNQIGLKLTELYIDLKPASLFRGVTSFKVGCGRKRGAEESQLVMDEKGAYDAETPVLKVEICNQKLLVFNHGCHPTSYGAKSMFAADWPGFVRDELGDSMFLQGACANTKIFARSHDEIKEKSKGLADAVKNIIHWKEIKGTIKSQKETISLPAKEEMQIEIEAFKIGETSFLTAPCELPAETGTALRKNYDFVLGYTNGLRCYIPTDSMIENKEYEATDSAIVYNHPEIDKGAEQAFIEKSLSLNPQDRELIEDRSLFVMSAGRCGTLTLAELLKTGENTEVIHHGYPYLVEETGLAYKGEVDKIEVIKKARYCQMHNAFKNGKIYCATEHNMTPFVEALDNERAKFLILARNPFDIA